MNIIVTLKCGLEVSQGHWKWHHSKAWEWFSILLLVIWRYLVSFARYSDFFWSEIVIFLPHLYLRLRRGDPVGISRMCLILIKLEWLATVWWRNYDNVLCRFHRIPERNGQTDWRTDGRTDRRTELLYKYSASEYWLEWGGYPTVKKINVMFSRFDRIHACDRWADGRTDILRQHNHTRVYAMHRTVKALQCFLHNCSLGGSISRNCERSGLAQSHSRLETWDVELIEVLT